MIYLFDINERLLKVIRKPAIKSALQKYSLTTENYVSERLTAEVKALNDDELELVEYMAIQSIEDPHLFNYFYVAQKSTKDQITTFIGVQSGIEELRKSPVYDKRPKSTQAKPIINELLQGTNWQARYIAETTLHSTNFYYTSVFEALKKLCKVWGLEMQFFVEMNGNSIGARYIDFKKKIGEAVGKRVVYGHNALEILQEVERTNIFTAIVGRGKGEQVSSAEESGKGGDGYGRKITFEDVVWSKAKGDPLDKPKGQKYLEIPEMTQRYGIKNSDGSMRPKIGFVDFGEEEDPNELIKLTYQSLITASRPQLTLKTSSVYLKGVKIGDTIRVVRHDRKIDYDTRIFEITINRLNDQSTDTKLGDRTGESSTSKAQSVADKAIDEFINNEFNSFIQDLPDYIRTADGFNTNWYSEEDPTKKYPKKVMINDIWYKPDPEHEGYYIMYIWDGEQWIEIIRSFGKNFAEKIKDEFEQKVDQINQTIAKQEQRTQDALVASGANTSVLEEVKQTLQQFDTDFANIRQNVEVNKKSVEDNLRGLTRRFEELNTNRNYVLNSGNATISQSLKLSSDFIPDVNQARTFTMSVEVEGSNIGPNPANNRKRYGFATIVTFTDDSMWYPEVWETADSSLKRIFKTWTIPAGKMIKNIRAVLINDTDKADIVIIKPKLELGNQTTPWRETAESFAEAKLAEYAQTVDGRFTNLTEQYASKLEFQKVNETSKLYERVLGSSEKSLNDKIARMVMSNQIFQTEISRFSRRNLLKGTRALARYSPASEYNGYKVARSVAGPTGYRDAYSEQMTITATGTEYIGLFWARASQNDYPIYCYFYNPGTTTNVTTSTGYRASTGDGFCELRIGTEWKLYWVKWSQTSTNASKNVIFGRHGTWRGGTAGAWIEICAPALFEGHIVSDHVDAPEDMLDPLNDLSTKMTQIAGSWSIKNLNSNGDIVSQINATGPNVRIQGESIHLNGKALIDDGIIKNAMIGKGQIDTAHINEIDASKARIINMNVNNINGLNAEFIKSKIELALVDWLKGKRITAQNDAMDIDLNAGQINFKSNIGSIRRIDDTTSSQFVQLNQAGFIGEYVRDSKAARIVIGTNHDKSENTNNETFSGTRLWSGKTNNETESFYETVADRVVFYANGKYRSPWLFHNNTRDRNSYFIPMNENNVKHYIGRGDKFFAGVYANDFYLSGGRSIGTYLWDLLTCFSQIKASGWTFSEHSKRHIQSVLSKYGG